MRAEEDLSCQVEVCEVTAFPPYSMGKALNVKQICMP